MFPGNSVSYNRLRNLAIACAVAVFLSACGGSSDDDDDPPSGITVDGGGTKGPLLNADVEVFQFDPTVADGKGVSLGTGTTDDQGNITGILIPNTTTGYLLFEIRANAGTTDLTTGQAPIISSMTTLRSAADVLVSGRVYGTPLMTSAFL